MVFHLLLTALVMGIGCRSGDKPTTPDEGPSGVTISDSMPDDDGVARTVASNQEVLAEDTCYTNGHWEEPDFIYLDNGRINTFALVWFPENWSQMTARKAIVHLHGHCALSAVNYSKWHVLAQPKDMAVVGLQTWLDDNNPPAGYSIWYEYGQPHGFHLKDEQDTHPFIAAILEEYEATSTMLHGFSLSAATSLVVTYLDKLSDDLVDFTVFNAGYVAQNHWFRQHVADEAAATGDSTQFAGELYYFFLEGAEPPDKGLYTMQFVEDFGGQIVKMICLDVVHGGLFAPEQEWVRHEIVDVYADL